MKKFLTSIKSSLLLMALGISTFFSSANAQSFTEGFEGTLTDWYVLNMSAVNTVSTNTNWGVATAGLFAPQAGAQFAAVGSNSSDISAATGVTLSNWFFTPVRTISNGDVISFYTKCRGAEYPDRLEVRMGTDALMNVGTTPTSVGTYGNLLLQVNPALTVGGYPTTWTQYTITISGLSAPITTRIAFRYFVTDGGPGGVNSDVIGLDTYSYTTTGTPPTGPANDNCAGATTLTQGATCNPTTGTVAGATQSQVGCSGTANDDVWFKFTATTANAKVTVDGSSNFDAVFEVFSGSCGALTSIACVDNTETDAIEVTNLTNLAVGQTYFIRVYDWYATMPATTGFTICVQNFTPCSLTAPTGAVTETETCGQVTNGGCSATPAVYHTLPCGQPFFGSAWANANSRDIDAFTFTVTTAGTVTWAVTAEFPYTIMFTPYDCTSAPLTSMTAGACESSTLSYNFTAPGTYVAMIVPNVYSGYPCGTYNDYIATLNLPGVSTPTISAGGATTFCTGGSVVLTASGTGTFQWYNGTTPVGTGASTYTATTAGTYTVKVTNGGCTSALSTGITVTVNTAGNATFTYPSNSICTGGSNPSPTTSSAGTFTASPSGLVFVSATTGQINAATSTPGTYTVTYTTSGACPATSSQTITITTGSATFNYATSTICTGSANVTPTASGTGTFTASPAGLVFVNTTTGQINVAASTPGTYTVTYTTTGACPASATQTITITAGSATFNYASSTICTGSANVTPTSAGTGTFTASPAGLVFVNTTTGQINVAASTPGTYTITYTTTGACGGTATQTISIVSGTATFNYASSTICTGTANPTPTASGTGTFTASPAGLVFVNAATGQINVAASTPGTYTVTYTTSGTCSATATQTITIASGNAAFSYASNTICTGTANPTPTASNAGTFTSSPAGLVFISTTTGQINVAASTAGTYTVTHTTSGPCGSTATQTITIASGNPIFSYPSNTICTGSTNPIPTSTGTGVFTSAPVGLVFVSTATGEINVAGSAPGTYTVTRTTTPCSNIFTQTITIANTTNATFAYASSTICAGSANVTPTTTGTGTFTASPAGLVFANTSTGQINVAASTSGIYSVTMTANGPCGNATTQTIIIETDNSVFAYPSNTICIGSGNVTPTSTGTGTFTASPAGLVFANAATGEINIASSTAGTYTITRSTTGSCANSSTQSVTITATPSAGFSYAGTSYCVGSANASPVFTTGSSAGTFSSTTGLVINSATGVVNMATSAPGSYIVTNSIAASGSCAAATSNATITIVAKPTAVVSGGGTVCNPVGGTQTATVTVTLTGTAPFDFTYTNGTTPTNVTGHTSNTYTINTSASGTYSVSAISDANCSNTGTGSAVVTILQTPTVTLGTIPAMCDNGAAVTLTQGSPAGGTYSGTGVTGSSFDPSAAPSGTVITYTYADPNGCSATATTPVTITAAPTVSLSAFDAVCSNDPAFPLSGGLPAGGTYSGMGVTGGTTFNPAAAASGTVITYTYTDGAGCSSSASGAITISAAPAVTFSALQTVCSYVPSFVLAGGLPAGGTYSGTGVTGGNFDPETAGAGDHTITYTVTNSSGCSNSADQTITVQDCASLTENEIGTSLTVYPNPAHESVMVSFTTSQNTTAEISIVSVDGKTLYVQAMPKANEFTQEINTADFPNGIYLINIQTAQGSAMRRLVIQ